MIVMWFARRIVAIGILDLRILLLLVLRELDMLLNGLPGQRVKSGIKLCHSLINPSSAVTARIS